MSHERAKSILASLGVVGAIILYLALAVGALILFFWALPFLAAAANVLGAISVILVVPLLVLPLLFKRTRRFSGNSLVVVSFLLGVSTWLTATVWLNDLWGAAAVIIGVLMFGVGSVPLACLALLFHAKFGMLGVLLGQLAAVYILRVLGLWVESKAPQSMIDSAEYPVSRI